MNRNVGFRSLLFVWTSLVLSGAVWAADAEGKSPPQQPLKIQKIYFMFHPVCWRNFGATPPPTADKKLWTACYNRELKVNEKQNGIRRDHHWSAVVGTADEPCYLIADGISFEQFRERLVKASIAP